MPFVALTVPLVPSNTIVFRTVLLVLDIRVMNGNGDSASLAISTK
jgi:hypothetical protein